MKFRRRMKTEEKNEEPKVTDGNETANTEQETNHKSAENTTEETDPLTKLQAEYTELNDKFLRLLSEFDNFRKRTQREKIDLIKAGGSDVMKAILPVIDDFERAVKANEKTEDPIALKDGFNLIHAKFVQTLNSRGLKAMELIGTDFNSDISEAIANVPGDESQKGKVIDEAEKGYYLNETIIRFAKVVVGN